MSKVLNRTRKGLDHLENGKFQSAIKNFIKASSESKGTNLQRAVASFFAYEVAKYRREWLKKNFGNANLFHYDMDENTGKAWSDVDIAAVLVASDTKTMTNYLSKFLGRNKNAISFQRRYANGRTLRSWVEETGAHYTRYTQTVAVKDRLDL